ncbi:MAG: O-antigen ligase family protein, partial [Chitinophagaceae bacterium]|nr:O-antigen ligase family protein [Chitinophagaceae bacterium]
PLLWSMSLLLLLPLLSGVWSADKAQWMDIIRIKLPLFFLPLAFASSFSFSKRQWNVLSFLFLLLVAGGSVWSFFHYTQNTHAINDGYLKAKSLITPLQNDHVRFSWMVCLSALLSIFLFFKNKTDKYRWLFLVVAAWFVFYLHLLAARTGLLSFYLCALIVGVYLIFKKNNLRYGLPFLAVLFLLPVIAWFTLPSFKNRVKYMLYDFEYFKNANYLPGGNDAMRIISIKAGWQTMNEHPLTGVGIGDIKNKINEWYAAHYPQMIDSDKILPASEWMMYGAGTGWVGLLIFSFVMLIPFFVSVSEKLAWWLVNATAAFSFMADIGLEVQIGVFLYSFIVLCCWKCWSEVSSAKTIES